jgi:hypothetical protein
MSNVTIVGAFRRCPEVECDLNRYRGDQGDEALRSFLSELMQGAVA